MHVMFMSFKFLKKKEKLNALALIYFVSTFQFNCVITFHFQMIPPCAEGVAERWACQGL